MKPSRKLQQETLENLISVQRALDNYSHELIDAGDNLEQIARTSAKIALWGNYLHGLMETNQEKAQQQQEQERKNMKIRPETLKAFDEYLTEIKYTPQQITLATNKMRTIARDDANLPSEVRGILQQIAILGERLENYRDELTETYEQLTEQRE